MSRRSLGDASAMAKMWGFVALALGTLSFIQAHAELLQHAAPSTEKPADSWNRASAFLIVMHGKNLQIDQKSLSTHPVDCP
jgi:hypothetical protein